MEGIRHAVADGVDGGYSGDSRLLAKLSVIQAVVDIGQIWLAVVSVLFSLIGAFYYLRVIKLMYFDEPVANIAMPALPSRVPCCRSMALPFLALGILPQSLMNVCVEAIRHSLHLA